MYVEPIIGFRSWKAEKGFLLSSVTKHYWLRDRPSVAVCTPISKEKGGREKHPDAVNENCSCGFYGWHDIESALHNYTANSLSVVGAAVYWGRVQVHTQGFKAQYARPVALVKDRAKGQGNQARPHDWERRLNFIAMRYRIPVLPLEDLKPYALTFGSQIGSEID